MSQTTEGPDARWFVVLIAGAGVLSLGIGLFMEGGIGDVEAYDDKITKLEEEIDRLEGRRQRLKSRRVRLQSDPYMIETLARERLGYSKPGERLVEFPNLTRSGPRAERSEDSESKDGRPEMLE